MKPGSYTAEDAFLLDGMRLNPVVGNNGANLTGCHGETETYSFCLTHFRFPSYPDWFLVTAKDGSKMESGNTTDSRITTDDGLKKCYGALTGLLTLMAIILTSNLIIQSPCPITNSSLIMATVTKIIRLMTAALLFPLFTC